MSHVARAEKKKKKSSKPFLLCKFFSKETTIIMQFDLYLILGCQSLDFFTTSLELWKNICPLFSSFASVLVLLRKPIRCGRCVFFAFWYFWLLQLPTSRQNWERINKPRILFRILFYFLRSFLMGFWWVFLETFSPHLLPDSFFRLFGFAHWLAIHLADLSISKSPVFFTSCY